MGVLEEGDHRVNLVNMENTFLDVDQVRHPHLLSSLGLDFEWLLRTSLGYVDDTGWKAR